MSVDIRIEGIEEITEKLEEITDINKLKQAVGKACAIVERAAKQKAPKGNGELRRSIKSKVDVNGSEAIGTIYTALEYAPYVEFGTGLFAESGGRQDVPWNYQDDEGNWHSTSGMKPQPFLRPALNENREEVKRVLRGAILEDD